MGLGILGESYRTSVLNDFSIVSKAVFYILKEGNVLNGNLSIEQSLPVQINPEEIRGFSGSNHARLIKGLGSKNGSGRRYVKCRRDEYDDSEGLDISLRYDIYDEYHVRTMDGLLTNLGSGEDLSLCSKTATSLAKLKFYAGNDNFKTLFKWGEIEYYGVLLNVDFRYTAFSRWGTPLKADATVRIKKEPLGVNTSGEEIMPSDINELKLVYTAAKAYTSAELKANQAALGLTQALR